MSPGWKGAAVTPDKLEALREDWDFEAKTAGGKDGQGALPASLWETYSAMANTQGGLILLGAKERDDGSLQPTGIANIDQVEKDVWNTLQNPQKVSANLLTRGDVERTNLEGKTLLLLRVPKAPRSQLPVHLNQSIDRGTYVRVHEGDQGHQRQKTYLPAEGNSSASVGSSEPYDASSAPYDASSAPYDASSAVSRVRDSKHAPTELVTAAAPSSPKSSSPASAGLQPGGPAALAGRSPLVSRRKTTYRCIPGVQSTQSGYTVGSHLWPRHVSNR
jgi:Putative DNA-binding domain